MITKKVPMRRCVGCMESKPKKDLIRIVASPDGGSLEADPAGKADGRGTYLCRHPECFEKAKKKKGLTRSLGIPNVSEEDYEKLREDLKKYYEQ